MSGVQAAIEREYAENLKPFYLMASSFFRNSVDGADNRLVLDGEAEQAFAAYHSAVEEATGNLRSKLQALGVEL